MSVCIAGLGELEEMFFLVGCRGGSLTECKGGL